GDNVKSDTVSLRRQFYIDVVADGADRTKLSSVVIEPGELSLRRTTRGFAVYQEARVRDGNRSLNALRDWRRIAVEFEALRVEPLCRQITARKQHQITRRRICHGIQVRRYGHQACFRLAIQ